MKIHRVRLSDEEIDAISKATTYFFRVMDIGPHTIPEFLQGVSKEKMFKLAHRFRAWGTQYKFRDNPFYTRPRKSSGKL